MCYQRTNEVAKSLAIDKSCKTTSSILTILLESSGCPNIEETRNKISDSRLRLRRITSRSRETVQLLCIHHDLVLSLRRENSPFFHPPPTVHNPL